jgi:predicted lysophospholipase L1 biosynthesis ABC-type transport system permease subunit
LALGASGGRLVRQLITEHAVLALLASAVGAAAGYVTGQFLRSMSDDLPPGLQISFDLRMAVVSFLAGLTAVVGFGILPALKILRRPVHVGRGRRGFVAAQVAASCVLLVLSTLLWRGSQRLNAFEPSLDYRRMIVVDPQLRVRDFDASRGRAILEAMASRIRGIAGISSVAIGTEGSVLQSESTPPMLSFEVSPTYLDALGLVVVRGRGFYAGERGAAILSESAARALWPDREALAQTLTIGQNAPRIIVGIVHDSGLSAIGNRAVGEVYMPLSDAKLNRAVLIAHARAEPGGLLREVRDAAARAGVTPTAALFQLSNTSASSGPRLMTVLALVATVLAFIGVFGQVAFAVAQRTREIGIRMAVGAAPRDVLLALMIQQARPLVIGLSIGAFLAVVGARAMNAELYGLSPLDPVSLALGLGGFTIVAVIAIVLPGRRALRVDPALTLRAE